MLRLLRNAVNTSSKLSNSVKTTIAKREFTRNFIYMCKQPPTVEALTRVSGVQIAKPGLFCECGCGIRGAHTKGERELVEFLAEEIQAEKKAQKVKTIPTEIDGFKVKLDGADVELAKKSDSEEIVISFNVNHTVDTDEEPEINMNADKPDIGELKSKPTFEVDIKRGNQTLSFTCSFVGAAGAETPQENEYNDLFTIDEVTLFEGEWSDKTYAVAGEVLDGYLYDLLMNLLEEKGISNEFVEKLSEVATTYEHSAYIGLLEGISRFTAGK